MIRVLHFDGPEDARRRIAFLGVPPSDADRLVAGLRSLLVCVPFEEEIAETLSAALGRRGIPLANGKRAFLFSVSSREQVEEWMAREPDSAGPVAAVRDAVGRFRSREARVPCRNRVLDLSEPPRIMGILNVTDDSFSDGGLYLSAGDAIRRGIEMAREGADIIDVGGESTRPGSAGVPAAVEASRVVPVILGLHGRTDALISIDTTKAAVAREAVAAGAHIVNDTSAMADDPGMADVVRDSGCAVVLMHRKGTPATMQRSPSYESLFDELLASLGRRIEAAVGAGIPEERILVDPGIGFGKRPEDNLALHRRLADLRNLGRPVLFGSSRKSFLGKITGKEARDRLFGTAASVALAVSGGAADVIRVHDVKEMREVALVAGAIARGPEC